MGLDITQLQATGTQLDAVIAAWQALLDGTLKGDKGDTGDTGATGAAAGFGTITITATQLEPGAEPTATATLSGENAAKNITIALGIPKGATGAKGDTGATGETGATGATGRGISSITKSGETVTVTYTDDTTSTFTVLDGAKGDTGEQGEKGDAFTYADFTQAQLDALVQGVLEAVEGTSGFVTAETAQGYVDAHDADADAHATLFASKADSATTYTKTEVDSAVSAKYTKPSDGIPSTDMAAAVRASLALADSAVQDVSDKADADDVYTKAEIDAALANKEDAISANTYDAYGSASAAQTAANGYTDTAIANEVSRANAAYATPSSVNAVQAQIDALTSKSDVVDVVGTYANLQSYNTSTLLANDVVKVLSDSTHSDGRSYYRWVITNSVGAWEYIGTESVGYTKSETNALLEDKQDTISDLATIRSGAALGATAVQPETGKGLSSNDYTTTEKNKLAGIATGATANAASDANPQMDGTATAGTADGYARGDHVHPTDTTRAPVPTVSETTISGTVTPADNTLYAATITSALTINASSDVAPLYSADLILTIGTGGSIAFSTPVSVTGDEGYDEPTAGEVWEINILRGNVIVRKIQEAATV